VCKIGVVMEEVDKEFDSIWGTVIADARDDFHSYCLLFNMPEDTPFIFSDVHEYLMNLVEDVYSGKKGKRQAISLPPQHGKSKLLSIEAVSWMLGKNPSLNIALTGFSHELVVDFSMAVKDRVKNPLYKKVFPEAEVDSALERNDYWWTTKGGAIRAKSTGKKLTGRRVDILIVDDAHAGREEADSKMQRSKVLKWYLGDCRTRLAPGGIVFLIGTRWHPEDLIGSLTSHDSVATLKEYDAEDEIFEVTNFPAICVNEEMDPLGRKEGEALFPQVRNERFLNGVKAGFAAEGALYEWESQYQGNPQITGGGVTDVGNIPIVEEIDVPRRLEKVRGWDLAVTEKQLADYTATAKIALDPSNGNLYILKIYRNQLAWPKNQKLIIETGRKERIRVRMEAVAGFIACYQVVKAALLGVCSVTKSVPKGDKLVRANRWLPKAEAGKLFLVRGAWNQEFKDELESFPMGKHDDMVDAISIAFELVEYVTRKRGQAGKRPEGRIRPKGVRVKRLGVVSDVI
jgi:predicted phage terminase large subunit-like protein